MDDVSPALIVITILVVAGLLVIAYFVFAGSRGKRRYEDVPPGMRPGYSDEQLEKSVLERYMGWGLVLTAIMAVFFPIYLVQETNRIRDAEAGMFTASVANGEELYQANCAECHGAELTGGAAPHPYEEGESWPAPNLRTFAARYEANEHVTDVEGHLLVNIERGRPGTPMPPWSQGFEGPLTDQEVQDVLEFILVNQEDADPEAVDEEPEEDPDEEDVDEEAEEDDVAAATDRDGESLYAANCAHCHGPEGEGQVGPTLIGVFERHGREGVAGIVRHGIVEGTGTSMPPFQSGWFYESGWFTDEELEGLLDYLEELQPEELPEGADRWQTPGLRPFVPEEDEAPDEDGEDEDDDATTAARG